MHKAASAPVTVFLAKRIHTMNPSRPTASCVAVRDGRVLATGSLDDMASFGEFTPDRRFADKVLLPGFVEAHAHVFEGLLWKLPYVGFFDRRTPDGKLIRGLKTIEETKTALHALERTMVDPQTPMYTWGFDPIFFNERRMNRGDLDTVSTTRPIYLVHASMHLMTVNSRALQKSGLTRDTQLTGLMRDENGEPDGELHERPAIYAALRGSGRDPYYREAMDEASLRRFAAQGTNSGCTTLADIHNILEDGMVESLRSATGKTDFPARISTAMSFLARPLEEGIAALARFRGYNTDKLFFGAVKATIDGSIQGFSARIRWPGYHNGHANGIWVIAPEETFRSVEGYHRAGAQINIHTNGDEATEVALDAIEAALTKYPRPDHRHTLQHVQLADRAQFRRMKALGVCANLFVNHIYYWGDQHRALTVGPERAARMNATATALSLGVPLAMHSDAPVTPLAPLFTAWVAVNRLTAGGSVLGEQERIGVHEALHAITLGAAYVLKLDHLVGSIECGKFADFAVLEADPFEVSPSELKDVPVWGTVQGGIPFEAAH